VHGAEGGAGDRVTKVGLARDPIVVPCEANGVYDVVVSGAVVLEHVVDPLGVAAAVDATALTEVVGADTTVVVLV